MPPALAALWFVPRPVPTLTLTLTLTLLGCTETPTPTEQDPADPYELRPLSVADGRIVNDRGSEVLLRGVNLTSLGEYWQGDPAHPPTLATTEADWDGMQARGLQAIRLVVHWSRIEPVRGQIDQGYLDEVETTVELAAEHGMYTVIDFHQDAYSAFIATDASEVCPAGTAPGKGWDGAPQWATITDGLSTCITGNRNSAPAVIAAWNHFYDNTDGIRDRYVESWRAVAERFAGRAEVAGYDLINEPETSRPAGELTPAYEQLLADCTHAIREAEAGADFDHLVMLENTVPAGDPGLGLIFPDPARMGIERHNLVLAYHNYAESIEGTPLTIELTNDLYWGLAEQQGASLWIGEYGFWGTAPDTVAKARRYALDEDAHVQSGAWWQWRQPCGDPHSLHWDGSGWVPDATIEHLNRLSCPGDGDLGQAEPLQRILGRGYPRVAPGRIATLTSDPDTGELDVVGVDAPEGELLVVWTPTGDGTHGVDATGLDQLREHAVDGGRMITARAVGGRYTLGVRPR